MVSSGHISLLHIQRVLMLTMLITYLAPMLGSVESGLRALAHISETSQAGETIAYEVFNNSSNAVDFD